MPTELIPRGAAIALLVGIVILALLILWDAWTLRNTFIEI